MGWRIRGDGDDGKDQGRGVPRVAGAPDLSGGTRATLFQAPPSQPTCAGGAFSGGSPVLKRRTASVPPKPRRVVWPTMGSHPCTGVRRASAGGAFDACPPPTSRHRDAGRLTAGPHSVFCAACIGGVLAAADSSRDATMSEVSSRQGLTGARAPSEALRGHSPETRERCSACCELFRPIYF